MPAFKGAIFDLDGLLIDSEPAWRRAQAVALGELGARPTEVMLKETTGLGLDEALGVWRGWFPRISLDGDALGARLLELALLEIADVGMAMPGAVRLVGALRGSGLKLAVASSSDPRFIRAALARLGLADSFDALVSAREVARGKPHPDVYLAAALRLGLEPRECLAFEDSVHGLRAAKAAGMRCVAVPGDLPGKAAGFAEADEVLSSLEEFHPGILSGRLSSSRRAGTAVRESPPRPAGDAAP